MNGFIKVCGFVILCAFIAGWIQWAASQASVVGTALAWLLPGLVLAWVVATIANGGFQHLRKMASGLSGQQTVGASPAPSRAGRGGTIDLSGDVIERLCQQTGWIQVSREAEIYRVRPGDHTSLRTIEISCSNRFPNVLFQTWLGINFPLNPEPAGLFSRVLLRNTPLHWSSWSMVIGGSCEGCLTLVANVPPAALNAHLFDRVCREMVNEVNAFQAELHDKFRYSATPSRPGPPPASPPLPPRLGQEAHNVPVQGNLTDIRYLN